MESSKEEKPAHKDATIGRFGWGPFTPNFLQAFNKVQWFVVWMSMFYLLEELSHSLVNIAITTLERRYGLTSSETGFIVTAHHIGGLVVVVPISYLGARGHKPRYLAVGTFFVGVGSLLFLLPQVISDPYDYTDSGDTNETIGHVCDPDRSKSTFVVETMPNSETAEVTSESTTLYYVIFIIAEFILGCGDTPATTLAAPYIDENVANPSETSLYLGIYFAVGAVGAAIGYVSGGQSLALYVDFTRVDMDEVTITEDDPYWVGAWWIGFVALTIAFPMIALMIGGYPKRMPTARPPKPKADIPIKQLGADGKSEKVIEEKDDPKTTNVVKRLTDRFWDLFSSVFVLFRNPTYVLLVLGGCAQALIAIGMLPFQAKILQEKFNISPTEAGLILSVISVVGQGGGEIIGGLILRFWRLGPTGMLRFMAVFAAIAAGFSACFFITCPDIRIAGINAKYGSAELLPPADGLHDACHDVCKCDDTLYHPVCGSDDVMYITPCHAGCTIEYNVDGELSYGDCQCVRQTLADMGSELNATATNGRCFQNCESGLISFSALLLLQFMTLFATVPAASVLPLRCVREEHGGLAVGVQWTFLRLLGVLPGPVMAGVVIDSACDFWGTEGSCLLYDTGALSWRLFLCWVVFQAFVVAIWTIGAQLYRPKWAGQTEADMEIDVVPPSPDNLENGTINPTFNDGSEEDSVSGVTDRAPKDKITSSPKQRYTADRTDIF